MLNILLQYFQRVQWRTELCLCNSYHSVCKGDLSCISKSKQEDIHSRPYKFIRLRQAITWPWAARVCTVHMWINKHGGEHVIFWIPCLH